MQPEPLDGVLEAQMVQVDDQVNGAAPANTAVPVHEFGAGDRERSLRGMPLELVEAIRMGSPDPEHRFQGDGPKLIRSLSDLLEGHGSELILGLMLTHCFILNMWLFSVRRSTRAAVRL